MGYKAVCMWSSLNEFIYLPWVYQEVRPKSLLQSSEQSHASFTDLGFKSSCKVSFPRSVNESTKSGERMPTSLQDVNILMLNIQCIHLK